MDFPDWLGPGICHQFAWRTMGGAWLCDRCTGLYIGGLLGVALGGLWARRLGTRAQLLFVVALQIPVLVDKLILGINSPWDVTPWRVLTGFLGGSGLGAFLGARAALAAEWPAREWLASPRPAIVVAGCLALGVTASAFGTFFLLDIMVFFGLIALCFVGTVWVLSLIARFARLLRRMPESGIRPMPVRFLLIGALVVAELIVVAVVPNEYKPHLGWLWEILSWFGL